LPLASSVVSDASDLPLRVQYRTTQKGAIDGQYNINHTECSMAAYAVYPWSERGIEHVFELLPKMKVSQQR
jgi:hypothetical protein